MGNYSYSKEKVTGKQLEALILEFPEKMGWFLSKGYAPHYYQVLFHTDKNEQELTRFRHLVADRKTTRLNSSHT